MDPLGQMARGVERDPANAVRAGRERLVMPSTRGQHAGELDEAARIASPAVRRRCDLQRAAVCRDVRRYDEALQLFSAAVPELRREGAELDLARVLANRAGIASTLRTLPQASYPDLIVTAYGTAGCDVDHLAGGEQMLPIGSEAVVEVVDKFDVSMPQGMLIVASAGNMGSTREHYPAAFDSVLGVGALDGTKGADSSPWSDPSRTAPVASFSNTGDWVDVYATGVDLPTTHVRGVRFESTSPIIDGIATVDGTSFSTPEVLALIAEQMSITGRSARQVRDDLIADGETPQPECGTQVAPTGVAIVPADLALPITAPATATPVSC